MWGLPQSWRQGPTKPRAPGTGHSLLGGQHTALSLLSCLTQLGPESPLQVCPGGKGQGGQGGLSQLTADPPPSPGQNSNITQRRMGLLAISPALIGMGPAGEGGVPRPRSLSPSPTSLRRVPEPSQDAGNNEPSCAGEPVTDLGYKQGHKRGLRPGFTRAQQGQGGSFHPLSDALPPLINSSTSSNIGRI